MSNKNILYLYISLCTFFLPIQVHAIEKQYLSESFNGADIIQDDMFSVDVLEIRDIGTSTEIIFDTGASGSRQYNKSGPSLICLLDGEHRIWRTQMYLADEHSKLLDANPDQPHPYYLKADISNVNDIYEENNKYRYNLKEYQVPVVNYKDFTTCRLKKKSETEIKLHNVYDRSYTFSLDDAQEIFVGGINNISQLMKQNIGEYIFTQIPMMYENGFTSTDDIYDQIEYIYKKENIETRLKISQYKDDVGANNIFEEQKHIYQGRGQKSSLAKEHIGTYGDKNRCTLGEKQYEKTLGEYVFIKCQYIKDNMYVLIFSLHNGTISEKTLIDFNETFIGKIDTHLNSMGSHQKEINYLSNERKRNIQSITEGRSINKKISLIRLLQNKKINNDISSKQKEMINEIVRLLMK